MSPEFYLYMISVLHNINDLCQIAFIIALISLVILFVCWVSCDDDEYDADSKKTMGKGIKKCLLIIYITTPLLIVIPGSKTMYAMLSTSIIKQSDVPERVLKILDAKLSEYEGER